MLNALTGKNNSLYSILKKEITEAEEIKIIVSFLMESGVKLIIRDLKKQALKGADIRIITGRYLGITEPSALYLIKNELGDMVDLRFYNQNDVSFHPKAYFFKNNNRKVLIIGSSNLSHSALKLGVEWNYRIINEADREAYKSFEKEFDRIYEEETIEINNEVLKNYAAGWKKNKIAADSIKVVKEEKESKKPEPRGAQIEALYELQLARDEGVNKGMVAAATGVGKTYLATFDSIDFDKDIYELCNDNVIYEIDLKEDSKIEVRLMLDSIRYYDNHAEDYFERTFNVDMGDIYEKFLKHVNDGGHILDAGCGSGRDSLYFKKKGYELTALDGSREMVRLSSELLNQEVLHMNFKEIDMKNTFDGIWACSSLLHVSRGEIKDVLQKLFAALKSSGVIYMSFKHGRDQVVRHGRLFNNYNQEQFSELINNFSSVEVIKLWKTVDKRPDREDEQWLNVLVKKS